MASCTKAPKVCWRPPELTSDVANDEAKAVSLLNPRTKRPSTPPTSEFRSSCRESVRLPCCAGTCWEWRSRFWRSCCKYRGWHLLVVIKLGSDVVGIVSAEHSGHRSVICIAAEDCIGPHNAIGAAVGRNRKISARLATDEIRPCLEGRRTQSAAIELKCFQVVTLGPHIDFR